MPSCCPPPLSLHPVYRWAIAIYAPAAYIPDLALPPGTAVGTVGVEGSLGSSTLTVRDPAAFVDDRCAPGRHGAVWTAIVVSGQLVSVRVYVDPTSGGEATYGAYRLTLCDSPFLVFRLRGAFTAPIDMAVYTWRAFVTPLDPTTGAPLPHSRYEMRAIVPIPHVLRVTAKYLVRSQTLVFSGQVIAAGGPDANAGVYIDQTQDLRDPVELSGTTAADGTFTIHEHVRQSHTRKTLYLGAYTWKDEACTTPSPLRGCSQHTSTATLGFTATIPKR